MNSRTLSILGLCTIAIVIIGWGLSTWRTPGASNANTALYPELQGKLDTVQAIKIFGAADRLEVELARSAEGDNQFLVTQRSYPADSSKVRRLLINLESAKRREEKTSNPDNYSALGVQASTSPNATGTRLELAGTPVNLMIGKRDATGSGTYVRRVEDKASWLTDVELDATIDPRQWLQHDVLDVAANRIANIRVQMTGEKPYEIIKQHRSDANYEVSGIPKGRELNSVTAPNAATQVFAGLTLEDVEAAKNLEIIKVVGVANVTAFDGLTLTCTGYQTADVHWITVKAAFDEALAKKNFEVDPKISKEEADKALQESLKKGADESTALNKKSADWAYAIPAHKFDSLFKPMEQLLKKNDAKTK